MRGRVFGALSAIAQSGIAVGAVAVGLAVQAVGVISTVVAMGAVYVLITLGMSLNPALRRMGAAKRAPVDGMTMV
jgi:predicted MFS family arabinose efflux permease